MTYASDNADSVIDSRDTSDPIVAAAWIGSELLVEVIGPFYWAALVLLFFRAVS